MQGQFANYQIGVEIGEGLPKDCCEVTVKLNDELALIQGWGKRVFICRKKEVFTGLVLRPIHKTEVDLAIYMRESDDKQNFEIQLNSVQIKLFKL